MLIGTLPAVTVSSRPWIEQVIVEDAEGNPLNLIGCDISIRLCGPHIAERSARVDVLTLGIFAFTFDALDGLSSGYFDLACDISRGGITNPLFRFTVPITSECRR